MKTLILVRHAKSSWKFDLPDKKRPLKKRGISDAYLVSAKFKDENPMIDIIFSSPANRAFSTCKIFMNNLKLNSSDLLHITDELYDFSGEKVKNFINKLDDTYNNVLIFGHNNALNKLANELGNKYIEHLPTCGLVKILFNSNSWKTINSIGKTDLIIFPKHLKTT